MTKEISYEIIKKRKFVYFIIEKTFTIPPSYALKNNDLYIFLDDNNLHTFILKNIPLKYIKKIGKREVYLQTKIKKNILSSNIIKLTN